MEKGKNFKQCLGAIDVIILAGGLGTRLASALPGTPKILAPVAGEAFLSLLIGRLRQFGARRLILGLGHLADSVLTWLGDNPPEGLEVIPVVEPEPLGTAGAIRFLAPWVRSDPVMVMNGDSFVDADLCDFLEFHLAGAAEASLIAAEVDDPGRYGSLDVGADGGVIGFWEKADAGSAPGGAALVNAGVYLMGARMIERIGASTGPSLERDIFQRLPAGAMRAMAGRFAFLDIGTPEDLDRAGAVLSPYLNA